MSANVKTSKAAPEKKEIVKRVQDLGKKYPIIGVLNMSGLPAKTLLSIKKQLRGKVELVMTRKTILMLGLKKLKLENGEKLVESLQGMPALMFTSENPFALYNIIKKSKTPAPAKPGDIAPYDITIPEGPTPFGPGPIISEFAQLGIKAGVEDGKVAVKVAKVVVEEGQAIEGPLASMLQKLGIEPMEIGMDLHTVYEKGILYGRSVLDIDEEQFMANLGLAASGAFNVAVEIGYATKDTIEPLLGKAYRGAHAVGLEGGILAPELVNDVLAKAYRQAKALASEGDIQTQ